MGVEQFEDLHQLGGQQQAPLRAGLNCVANPDCRVFGNLARRNALAIGAGHSFFIALGNCFPINVLGQVKACPEVCRVFCASANPLTVIVAETEQGRGVMGVIDGAPPKGAETDDDVRARKELLRRFGYKL